MLIYPLDEKSTPPDMTGFVHSPAFKAI